MNVVVHWKDVEPDAKVPEISGLLKEIGLADAVKLIVRSFNDPLIFITDSSKKDLYAHLESSAKEMGGLLIGKSYSLPYTVKHGYSYASIITDSIPSMKYRNSASSLSMNAEIWNEVAKYLDEGKIIIGWYHSHPNIGAFFSSIDRLTQRAFFSNAYSLGVVVDPLGNERKCYFGMNSIEVPCDFEVIPDIAFEQAL